MNAFFSYIVAVVVSQGVLYTAFAVFLRKEPLFRFNRIYLLSSLLLSFVIPLITFIPEGSTPVLFKSAGRGIMNIITLSPVEINGNAGSMPSFRELTIVVYLLGMFFFASRLFVRLRSLYILNKNGSKTLESGTEILWSQSNIPPFSFLWTMYLPVNLKDTSHLSEVIRHEKIHIMAMHSFDILCTQLLQVVCWFNPFIPLTEKALREIHEFEADKAVISSGTDPVVYTRILFGQDKTAMAVVLGNNFNYSLIKLRLTMFYKKGSRFARLKTFAVMPVAVILVTLISIACNQNIKHNAQNTDSTGTSYMVVNGAQKGSPIDSTTRNVTKTVNNGVGSMPAIPPPPPPPPSPPPPPVPTEKSDLKDDVYKLVDNMPRFTGCDEARIRYIMNNVKYPAAALEKGIEGTVYIAFIVEKDGSITNAKVIKGLGKPCDMEALRVIRAMPKWIPGTQKGNPVRVQFNMPIKFKLGK